MSCGGTDLGYLMYCHLIVEYQVSDLSDKYCGGSVSR